MEQKEIKKKIHECFDALSANNRTTSFTVDEDFYGGITITFNLVEGEEYYARVEVTDNGVVNGQIAYSGDDYLLAYGVSNITGGHYEECIYDEDISKKIVLTGVCNGVYESIIYRHEGFVFGDKIKFFGKEFIVLEIDFAKVYLSDLEKVYETEVYEIGPITGLMLSQPDTSDNPIIITKCVLEG